MEIYKTKKANPETALRYHTQSMEEILKASNGSDLTAAQTAAFNSHKAAAEAIQFELAPKDLQGNIVERQDGIASQYGSFVDPASIVTTKKESGLRVFSSRQKAKLFHTFLRGIGGDRRAEDAFANATGQSIFAGQTEGTNNAGGYLVPTIFSSDILSVLLSYGVFRKNAKVVEVSGDSLLIPRRNTGTTAYYVGENSSITTSTKTWNQIQLTLKKLAVLSVFSNELAEDAIISVSDDLANEMAYNIAYSEDAAGFIGTGGSTYGGIVGIATALDNSASNPTTTSAAGVVVAAGNAWSEITLKNLTQVMSTVTSSAHKNARWYCSPQFFGQVVCNLISAAGGSVFEDLQKGFGRTFLGYPVELVEVMPSTESNSSIPLLFGDLSMAAVMGIKPQVRIERTDSATIDSVNLFQTDSQAVRLVSRYDIVCHSTGANSEPCPMAALKMLNS